MPQKVEAWQCDYCNRRYSSKGNARRHEKICIFNPEVKACVTCRYSYYKQPEAEPGCKAGKIPDGGRWKRSCSLHKYQGFVGITMDEDYGEDYTYEDYRKEDY